VLDLWRPGITGEHKTKRSDLKAVFRQPSQQSPLFFRSEGQTKSLRIGSLDNRLFKFPDRLCASCNNTLTQPHDRAWEQLSEVLRDRIQTMRGPTVFRAQSVFSYDTHEAMLHAHLFFVKVFGCMVLEGRVPIDVASFAAAIRSGKAHPSMLGAFSANAISAGLGSLVGGRLSDLFGRKKI
jgi:hypothetical protein